MSDKILQIIVFLAIITAPWWAGVVFHPDHTDAYSVEEPR